MQSLRQVARGDPLRGNGDGIDRAQGASGQKPSADQRHDQRDRRRDEQHEKEAAKGFFIAFQGGAHLHDV